MSQNTNESVFLLIQCPSCCQVVEHRLAWLAVKNDLPCPKCGNVIHLQASYNGLRIHTLAKACVRVDRAIQRRDWAEPIPLQE
jgi:hypothetical protein